MTTTIHWNPVSEPPEHNRQVLVLWWGPGAVYCYGVIPRRSSSSTYVRLWADLPGPELFGNSEELGTDK